MATSSSNPKVDFYFTKATRWQEELETLRAIVLDSSLTETLKWGVPCYTFQNSNVVLIHDFKEYCALLFFKGALLQDDKGILIQQTKNTQATRQIRFTSVSEIVKRKAIVKRFISEAIELEKTGVKVTLKKTKEFAVPEEFQRALHDRPALRTAFEALTPGRQRAYLLHFAQPKQSKTRESRIEKHVPRILKGKGLDDE